MKAKSYKIVMFILIGWFALVALAAIVFGNVWIFNLGSIFGAFCWIVFCIVDLYEITKELRELEEMDSKKGE